MADIYLQPSGVYKVGVRATLGENTAMNFIALLLDFDVPFSDYNTQSNNIYPSYDGIHAGLLVPYEYTIIGGSTVTPLVNGRVTVSSNASSNRDVVLFAAADYRIRMKLASSSDSQYFIENWYGGAGHSNSTVGIMVAHFSDDVYTVGFITNSIDPESDLYTYLPPTVDLNSQNWGYAMARVDVATGYAPISGYFRIERGATSSNAYLVAGDTIAGKFYHVSSDPYGDFPNPGDEYPGGGGTPRGEGDIIDFPTTPAISAADSGFITLYNPSLAQIQALAAYMWSGPFDLSSFKKIFADPMDCILGLSIVPVQVPNGGVKQITVGNISTGIAVSTAATNYVELDCGSVTVHRAFESYLDYPPFTTVEIYLPYIGVRHLEADNIIPAVGEETRTIHVVYKIDLFSGACIAFIKCKNSVMYSFVGQCSTSVPVTGQNWTEFYKAVTNVVCSAIGTVTAGGSSTATSGASGPLTGEAFKSHGSDLVSSRGTHSGGVSASSIADMVFSYKPRIDRSGVMGSAIGMLGIQKPYLILRYPQPCVPDDAYKFIGYPSFFLKKIGDLSGYLVVEEIHLEHIPATENEIEEIYSLLKSGVIV